MKEINASIITIGDELLIGQTIDTNSAFIAQELNKLGIWIRRRVAVGDVKKEILDALKEESKNSQVVLLTGGLGPTRDDITKKVLCEYFNSGLIVNEEALNNVKDIFNKLNRPLIEINLKQAEVPENCIVLQNKRGTAPGMWFEKEGVIIVSMPGVPNEMKGLMLHSVIPKLKSGNLPVVLHKTLLLAGKGESEVAELIKNFENSLSPYIKLAYLPAYGLLRLRLTGRSDKSELLENDLNNAFNQLKELVKEWIIADYDTTIQEAILKLMIDNNKTLATAESCSGGYIAHLITSIPGSSKVYKGSIVSYANEIKMTELKVKEETLNKYGAVSEQTVKEMFTGLLSKIDADFGIATSGIMGPDGGSEKKPVGTVWIAVGNKTDIKTIKYQLRFNRERNIEQTAIFALVNLFRLIKG
ncbi:MAG TPA: CinA family nicotinamide mononucleotide deamidase-related protein [Flavisolibacter sp.]|nr:CinA family nicotinamide mononucleotide deamidase-related protein [Flavisolibacter sp.]